MSDELKPCPFCGGPADMEEIKSGFYISWSVGCRSIDGPDECIGQQSLLSFARKSEAIAAWNRRAPMTAPTPAGEEMEKLLERAREIAADDVSAMTASWVDTQAFARALLSSPDARREALEEAAKVAERGCLTHPDGGSPTEPERELCEAIAADIRALSRFNGRTPHGEWKPKARRS